MEIGEHDLTQTDHTFVIAEAGSNHNGDFETAKALIDAAVEAGADAVKFQVFNADDLYVEESGYDIDLDEERSIHEVMSSLELPKEWIPELHDYCEQRGILFLSTPFDEAAVDLLNEYVPVYKIASSSITHLPFLRSVASTGKPVLMSTGAHDSTEVETAVQTLQDGGASDIALFHCVSSYPTPIDQINVRAVDTLKERFSVPIGLSDHTTDPVVAPCAAVSRGAVMVEKHFTLDRSMRGPDHSFALEPDELSEMVTRIRQTEQALGDGTLAVRDVESHTYEVARRSVHATRVIERGERITESNTAVLRPGKREKGLPPAEYDDVLGRKAATRIEKNAGVTWSDVNGDPSGADQSQPTEE